MLGLSRFGLALTGGKVRSGRSSDASIRTYLLGLLGLLGLNPTRVRTCACVWARAGIGIEGDVRPNTPNRPNRADFPDGAGVDR